MGQRLPAVKPKKEVVRALERAGFFIHHTTGSHYFLKHPDRPRLRDRGLAKQGTEAEDPGHDYRAGRLYGRRIYLLALKLSNCDVSPRRYGSAK
jgi:hypothetical protein